MTGSHLQIFFYLVLMLTLVSCSDSGDETPVPAAEQKQFTAAELGEYSHGALAQDMRFLWRLGEDSIDIRLAAPTTGWVAVGFNPDAPENMKGANLILGYVKNGKAEVVDHYGTMKDKHKEDEAIGGKNDVTNISGVEASGTTVISFTLPLDSGDAMDKPLNRGDNTVLLSYGRSDRIVLKHTFRAILRVNLSTGRHTIVRMR